LKPATYDFLAECLSFDLDDHFYEYFNKHVLDLTHLVVYYDYIHDKKPKIEAELQDCLEK